MNKLIIGITGCLISALWCWPGRGLGERQPLRGQHGARGRGRHRTHQCLRRQLRACLRRRQRAYQHVRRHHGGQVTVRVRCIPILTARPPTIRLDPATGAYYHPPAPYYPYHPPVAVPAYSIRMHRLRGRRGGRRRRGRRRGDRVVQQCGGDIQCLFRGRRRRQCQYRERLQRRRGGRRLLCSGRELRDAASRRHVNQQRGHHVLPRGQHLVPTGLRRERRVLPRGASAVIRDII